MQNKINWFPGHMTASLRKLDTSIKQCDVILYVLDARCPKSCVNPSFADFASRKPVLYVLNKADLAPANPTFRGISLDSSKTNSAKKLIPAIKKLLPNKARIHAMVIGVPNCGKSTLINNLAGARKAQVADKPGVTRQPQWVSAAGDFQLYLLDTPGILWPNLEDQRVAKNLAYIGSIKDDILDIVELACELLKDVKHPDTFEGFCKKRGFILKGGAIDELRGAKAVLVDFRLGKFGKFNLDSLLDEIPLSMKGVAPHSGDGVC